MPARRAGPDDPGRTRDDLMDAAVALLRERGVLAGLNLSEVADRAGVTPANIYYHFEDRQGLLRAALNRELQRLAEPIATASSMGFVERRLAMFDTINARPDLALSALLALDGDPDFEPMQYLDATLDSYREQVARRELSEDADLVAIHLITVALSMAVAIYIEPVARQLGTTPNLIRRRLRDALGHMLAAAVEPSGVDAEPE